MEHIKTKKHVLKKELPVIGSHSFMPGGERSTRNSVLKKQRITGKISR